MDGEQDGAQAQGEEQQGQQGDQQADDKQQGQKAPVQVGAPDDEEIRAALAERDEKIAELERQIADAAKTVESAEALAKQIEELKAASDAERCEFELRPGRGRSRKAGGGKSYWVARTSLVRAAFLFRLPSLGVWVGANPGTNNPERSDIWVAISSRLRNPGARRLTGAGACGEAPPFLPRSPRSSAARPPRGGGDAPRAAPRRPRVRGRGARGRSRAGRGGGP